MAPNSSTGKLDGRQESKKYPRNSGSLEENAVNERSGASSAAEYYEELFRDLMLTTDDADGRNRGSCFCKSRCFCENDDDSCLNDEDSESHSVEQRLYPSSTSSSFSLIIDLHSDSSSSSSDSEEEKSDKEALSVLNLANFKLSTIEDRDSRLREYLLLKRIKSRLLESLQVTW